MQRCGTAAAAGLSTATLLRRAGRRVHGACSPVSSRAALLSGEAHTTLWKAQDGRPAVMLISARSQR